MNKAILFYPLICLLFLLGCKTKSKTVNKNPETPQIELQLAGSSWLALNSSNSQGEVYNFSKSFEISFDSARASLRLDVNTCNNQYSLSNGKLTFGGPFGCTKKCCDAKDGTELMKTLQAAEWSVSLDGNKNLLLENPEKGKIVWKSIVR